MEVKGGARRVGIDQREIAGMVTGKKKPGDSGRASSLCVLKLSLFFGAPPLILFQLAQEALGVIFAQLIGLTVSHSATVTRQRLRPLGESHYLLQDSLNNVHRGANLVN
jgi:hypothetical protein